MNILDGKVLAAKRQSEIKLAVEQLKRSPKLALISLSQDPASRTYLLARQKAAKKCGIEIDLYEPSTFELLELIAKLNKDESVDGIMIDRPFPSTLDERQINNAIDYLKDVEGVTTTNIGRLVQNLPCFIPPTAGSCLQILKEYNIEVEGKNVLVIGRSASVGRPLMTALLHLNATVTVAHSRSKDLKNLVKKSDIVIVAIGKANFIDEEYLHPNLTLLDVGIHYLDGKIVGDVLESAKVICLNATPTPGGVGPLTNYILLENLIKAYKWQHE